MDRGSLCQVNRVFPFHRSFSGSHMDTSGVARGWGKSKVVHSVGPSRPQGFLAALADRVHEQGDLVVDLTVFRHQGADFLYGVDDGGVIATAEHASDVGVGQVC